MRDFEATTRWGKALEMLRERRKGRRGGQLTISEVALSAGMQTAEYYRICTQTEPGIEKLESLLVAIGATWTEWGEVYAGENLSLRITQMETQMHQFAGIMEKMEKYPWEKITAEAEDPAPPKPARGKHSKNA